ncbi:molybdenum cofactor guanylyltransferase [Nocardioides litoris]|uniref:molybdenum cofactor guanylyltransferase n=1 Tax=Nocardioides litoris TaxID=1926648 RepID=UPI00112489EA|nr:NTP transferase domain-containing protein [Nocardioides litoris]
MASDALLDSYCAVVLAGGRATRLGGFDKGSVEVGGRSLLAHALEAVVDAAEVVVVGDQAYADRPVTFVVEDPRHGGPVAGLLTGVDSLLRRTRTVVVLAVDMPRVTPATIRRMQAAAEGRDGAVLVGPDGRRQLAFVVDRERLEAVRPDREAQHGHAVHRLLARLDLAEVAAIGEEHRDVDTWADLRDIAEPR